METNTHITILEIEEKGQGPDNTNREYFQSWSSPFKFIFVFPLICWMFWSFYLVRNWYDLFLYWINVFVTIYLFKKAEAYYKTSTQELTKYNEPLLKLSVWINNIDEILNFIEVIWEIIQKINKRKQLFEIFCNQHAFWIYNNLIRSEIEFASKILDNLRSDLSIRITEQQNILESTKYKIEKNITWTTELKLVSELQQARLDKQIEQFEELQRILIKT